jgi:hypothetical protein
MSFGKVAATSVVSNYMKIGLGPLEIGFATSLGKANNTHYVAMLHYDDNETRFLPTDKTKTTIVLPLAEGQTEAPTKSSLIMEDVNVYFKTHKQVEMITLDNALLIKPVLEDLTQVSETL